MFSLFYFCPCFQDQTFSKVIWRNANKNISVGQNDICYVTLCYITSRCIVVIVDSTHRLNEISLPLARMRHVAVRSLRTWVYSESRDKNVKAGEDMNKAIKYLFSGGNKKRSLVVAYKHVTKHVTVMKNDIYA